MNAGEPISSADGDGPEWAAAVAALAERAAFAFARAGGSGCFTVVDMQPWRLLDAWWLRQHLEPLARHSGLPVRYVPCDGLARPPGGGRAARLAPAWSVGTAGDAPVGLYWPRHGGRPMCAVTGQAFTLDGPVLVLAGDLAQRLPQNLFLSHHGAIQEWRAEPGAARQWHPVEPGRYPDWVNTSLQAYAKGLPSAMLSLPVGYWQFLEQALGWASNGCLIVGRAEGWSSLAQFREDAATGGAQVREDDPPVNFHWLGEHMHRLGASVHTLRASRTDTLQLVASRLPEEAVTLGLVRAQLAGASRAARGARARAVRLLAIACDADAADAAVAVLKTSAHDPALLRAAWGALALAAAKATPATLGELGGWLEQLMADNPWLGEDAGLLRAAGHLALACSRLDLALTALRALRDMGGALADDHLALARCLEQLGCLDAALEACGRVALRDPGQANASAVRERLIARKVAMGGPWRVQQELAGSPLMLDPLHADHAPMLARQMRDPAIPQMTVLPPLAQGDDGREWIAARLVDGQAAYAIVHRQLGFVGYLNLGLWETTAFISYWIGADYQGLGFCAPAIALARELAGRNGIDLLLSSVYDDNVRSMRALRRAGFAPMDVRAEGVDADRTFVMLPAVPMEAGVARGRLLEFCRSTGSGLCFGPDAVPSTDGATNCSSRSPS